jgi:hypothetical protein
MTTAILNAPRHRDYAKRLIDAAPDGAVVTVAAPKRTADQNAKLWAMLEDVARAKPEGRNWTRETWKAAFMHLRGHQVQFAEGLDGTGPFPVGFRSSRLTVAQMADLITLIQEWGDRHGVQWRDFHG